MKDAEVTFAQVEKAMQALRDRISVIGDPELKSLTHSLANAIMIYAATVERNLPCDSRTA
jgi:hypothetical protein